MRNLSACVPTSTETLCVLTEARGSEYMGSNPRASCQCCMYNDVYLLAECVALWGEPEQAVHGMKERRAAAKQWHEREKSNNLVGCCFCTYD